jgi:trimethylamine-N-oxide reductase cytochrome c-type subunit TorC
MKKGYFIFPLLLVASLVEAKIQYLDKTTLAFSQLTDKKSSGKILTTTPLTVIKTKGDKALVKLTGWNQGNLKRILYYSKGNRIVAAVFSKSAKYTHKVITVDKTTKKPWSKVEMTVWMEHKNLIDDVKPLFKKAQDLVQNNCGLCHNAHPAHEFTANQWPSVIKGMKPRTPLTKEQGLLITQFSQKHAKDMLKH